MSNADASTPTENSPTRDPLTYAALKSAETLLLADDLGTSLETVLADLGRSAGASRAYIITCGTDGSEVYTTLRWEWCAQGVRSQIRDRDSVNVPLREAGFGRWADTFFRGEAIRARVADLPADERALLKSQNVRAVLLVPFYVNGAWEGLIGFDECAAGREWNVRDEAALRTAAKAVGGAVRRYQAAEERRSDRNRYFALLQHSQDFVAVLDPDGVCTFASGAVEPWLGRTPDWYVGQNIFNFVHPEDRAEVRAAFETCLATHAGSSQREFRFHRHDGSWLWLDAIGVNRVHDLAVRGVVVNARDVTQRRQFEEQLRQSSKLQAVAQLAGGIAHDFNNLLTVINGFSELLVLQAAPNAPERGVADHVLQAGRKAAELIRQLLAFSRPQKGRPTAINLSRVIEEMAPLLRGLVGGGVELATRLASGLPPIVIDKAQMEQAIIYLASSARDAMPRGGSLTLATSFIELAAADPATHPGVSAGRYVVLTLRDTGVGIPESAQSHVFEPFFNIKQTGETGGLELAVVHGIVHQSGGHIRFETQLGKGTTFILYWPALHGTALTETPAPQSGSRFSVNAPTPSPDVPLAATNRTLPARIKTVLLVEDEPMIRRLASQALTKAGFRVIDRGDGEEALKWMAGGTEPIDILVTDVVMPRMNGRVLADRIWAKQPQLPVLFVSGHLGDIEMPSSTANGLTIFLPKPYRSEDLVQAVHGLTDPLPASPRDNEPRS